MSHDRGRRAACGVTIWSPEFHFDNSYDSTRRDGHGRWLWRLVRRFPWKCGEACACQLDAETPTRLRMRVRIFSGLDAQGSEPTCGRSFGSRRFSPSDGRNDQNHRRSEWTDLHRRCVSENNAGGEHCEGLLPNVKDEPRPWPARRVRHDDLDSVVSFRSLVRQHAA